LPNRRTDGSRRRFPSRSQAAKASAAEGPTASITSFNVKSIDLLAFTSRFPTPASGSAVLPTLNLNGRKKHWYQFRQGKKHRCQVPQVDVAELSHFLTVAQSIYLRYRFLGDNGERLTNLSMKSSSMSLCRT
jgi:hypothetical protein